MVKITFMDKMPVSIMLAHVSGNESKVHFRICCFSVAENDIPQREVLY